MDGIERIEPSLSLDRTVLPYHVKRALAYMHGNLAEKITLSDVVRACATSERTLLKQFRKCVGVSPLAYLRRHRLHVARRELLKAGSDEAISSIAIRCGYTHLARFAGDYRRLFGERPSATRQRVRTQAARQCTCRQRCSLFAIAGRGRVARQAVTAGPAVTHRDAAGKPGGT